jgi:hypothetical protein
VSDTKKVLDQTDRLVAALFAVGTCAGLNQHKPEDYLAQYDKFITILYDRVFDEMDAELAESATENSRHD